jgi:DNA polymerase-4
LKTIGDVQKLGLEDMTAICGEAMGEHFWRLCRGLDAREVVRDRDARSIGHETTFGDDLTDDEECHAVLLGLAEGVGRRLRRAGVRGRTVKLKLRFPPFTTLSRQTKLSARTHDDLEIYRAAKDLFDAARAPGAPVRLLGISMADLAEAPADTQPSLFDDPRGRERTESLLRAVDSIRDKFGKGAIRRGG